MGELAACVSHSLATENPRGKLEHVGITIFIIAITILPSSPKPKRHVNVRNVNKVCIWSLKYHWVAKQSPPVFLDKTHDYIFSAQLYSNNLWGFVLNAENASSQVAQVHRVVDDGLKIRYHVSDVAVWLSLDWIIEEHSHVLTRRRHSRGCAQQ